MTEECRDVADKLADSIEKLTPAEVDAELRKLGYDPKKVADWAKSLQEAIRSGKPLPQPGSLKLDTA